MNVAEWIIVGILSGVLLVFLIVGIVALAKFMRLMKEVRKLTEKGQDIADHVSDIADQVDEVVQRADNIAANVEDFSSIGGMAKSFVGRLFGGILSGIFKKGKRR